MFACRFRYLFVSVALLTFLATGCGPRVVAVTGEVRFNGQPVENLIVTFSPGDKPLTPTNHATGITDAAGKFSLKTQSGAVGLEPGEYVVTFVRLASKDDPDPDQPARPFPNLPADLNNPKKTPHKAQITPGCGPFTFELDPKSK